MHEQYGLIVQQEWFGEHVLLLFSNMFMVILNGFTLQELCVTSLVTNNDEKTQPVINSFSKFYVCELEKYYQTEKETQNNTKGNQDVKNTKPKLQTDDNDDFLKQKLVISLSNDQNFWVVACDITSPQKASFKILQHLVVTDSNVPLIKPQNTSMISGMCEVDETVEQNVNNNEGINDAAEQNEQPIEVSDCFPLKYGSPIITQVKQFTENKLLYLIATNNGHLVGITEKC